jgi:hypothetical protein
MEQDIKELLQANLEVSKENNKILRKMQGAQRWAQVIKVAYWLVMIALLAGAYYYVQPYVKKIMDIVPGLSKTLNSLPGFGGKF